MNLWVRRGSEDVVWGIDGDVGLRVKGQHVVVASFVPGLMVICVTV